MATSSTYALRGASVQWTLWTTDSENSNGNNDNNNNINNDNNSFQEHRILVQNGLAEYLAESFALELANSNDNTASDSIPDALYAPHHIRYDCQQRVPTNNANENNNIHNWDCTGTATLANNVWTAEVQALLSHWSALYLDHTDAEARLEELWRREQNSFGVNWESIQVAARLPTAVNDNNNNNNSNNAIVEASRSEGLIAGIVLVCLASVGLLLWYHYRYSSRQKHLSPLDGAFPHPSDRELHNHTNNIMPQAESAAAVHQNNAWLAEHRPDLWEAVQQQQQQQQHRQQQNEQQSSACTKSSPWNWRAFSLFANQKMNTAEAATLSPLAEQAAEGAPTSSWWTTNGGGAGWLTTTTSSSSNNHNNNNMTARDLEEQYIDDLYYGDEGAYGIEHDTNVEQELLECDLDGSQYQFAFQDFPRTDGTPCLLYDDNDDARTHNDNVQQQQQQQQFGNIAAEPSIEVPLHPPPRPPPQPPQWNTHTSTSSQSSLPLSQPVERATLERGTTAESTSTTLTNDDFRQQLMQHSMSTSVGSAESVSLASTATPPLRSSGESTTTSDFAHSLERLVELRHRHIERQELVDRHKKKKHDMKQHRQSREDQLLRRHEQELDLAAIEAEHNPASDASSRLQHQQQQQQQQQGAHQHRRHRATHSAIDLSTSSSSSPWFGPSLRVDSGVRGLPPRLPPRSAQAPASGNNNNTNNNNVAATAAVPRKRTHRRSASHGSNSPAATATNRRNQQQQRADVMMLGLAAYHHSATTTTDDGR